MTRARSKYWIATAIMMVAVAPILPGQQKPVAGPFTAEQSGDGGKLYRAMCSSCHGADLAGHNDTPPLAGKYFARQWRDRSVQDLMGYLQTTMPPRAQTSLTEKTSADLVAFILESNGVPAGSATMMPATNVMIRAILPPRSGE